MAFAVLLLFLFWPILSLPFVLLGYFYDARHRTLYSMLLGIFVGLIAYYFQPPASYDLFRHHELVDEMSGYTLNSFFQTLSDSSEPLQGLINYAVAATHNHDLLQFSIVALGYGILFYIIGDFARRKNIKKSKLLIVLLFTLSSFVCINFFSGLWNTLAMMIFALAFYQDVFIKKWRFFSYALYLITPLIHSSMVFPLAVLIIYKLSKGKFNFKSLLMVAAIFIVPSILLPIINYFTDIPIFAQLEPMYNSYFLNGSQFNNLYGGFVIPMELLKTSLYVIAGLLFKSENDDEAKLRSFVLLLSTATLILVVNGLVFLRFVLLVQFVGSMLLMLYFSRRSYGALLLISSTLVLDVVFLAYQYLTLKDLSFSPLSLNVVFDNIVQVFIK